MIKEAPRHFIDTVIKKPHTGYITYAVFDVNRRGYNYSHSFSNCSTVTFSRCLPCLSKSTTKGIPLNWNFSCK